MNFLSVENCTKTFGERALFENITFGIEQGQKVALVAKNGAGKTTLLRCLMGLEPIDTGNIVFRKDIRISFMDQSDAFPEEATVMDVIYDNSLEIFKFIHQYNVALEENDLDAIEKLSEIITENDAWDLESKISKVLSILKLQPEGKLKTMSGGQKKRVALAKVILSEADFMLLDEPTNHLDLDMIEWLESYLSSSNSTVFMVTHDRYFLESICDTIYELENPNIYKYNGNFSYYLFKKAERQEQLQSTIEKAQNTFRKELEWIRRQPKARGTKQKARIDAFVDIKETASQRINKDQMQLSIKMERLGTKIVEIHKISKAFGEKVIMDNFSYHFQRTERVGIVGNNGTGKTTFIRMILGEELPDKGKIVIGETIHFGHYTQENLVYEADAKVIDIVRDVAEFIPLEKGKQISAAQLLERFLFPRDMHFQFVSKLSGGEKRRLKLLRILMSNPNFLVLDEPTNDLDIFAMAALEEYLLAFQGSLIVISHDRYFMDKMVDHLFLFEGNGVVKDIIGNYSEYRVQEAKLKREQRPDAKAKVAAPIQEDAPAKKLSFKEKAEFEALEKTIGQLELEKQQITDELSSGDLENDALLSLGERLGEIVNALETHSNRWLELSEFA